MVKRYELSEEWGQPVMSEYDHGDWVNYEDYVRLEQHYSECRAAWLDAYEVNEDLQRKIDSLERDLEHIRCGERGSW